MSSLPDFQRVMALAAHRTGRLLNQADLARDAALTHPTTHRYLNLLETGCLVTRIRPFATNPNVALVKTPKLLWTDCGLAASLAGIKTPAEATARPDAGFWLEQTLFQTLQSWRALDPLQRRLHFWRDRPGHEVDFILEQNGKLVALEIKSGSTVTSSDAAGIRAFRDSLKKKPAPGAQRGVACGPGPAAGHRSSGAAVGLDGGRWVEATTAGSKYISSSTTPGARRVSFTPSCLPMFVLKSAA